MRFFFIGLSIFLFTGCSTTYSAGKIIYTGAKTAYIELELDNPNIERIDNILVIYDEVRRSVVGEVKIQKKTHAVSLLETMEIK